MHAIVRRGVETITRRIHMEELRSRRVLITGGAGFIGSWLCDVLVSTGVDVLCADNLSTGLFANVRHLVRSRNFAFQRLDVSKSRPRDRRFHAILHLASRCSPEEYGQHPIETLEANFSGTQNMLELARKNDSVLLFTSSSEVYGDADILPTPETHWGRVNPIGPRSCYDEGKRVGEALCMAYCKEYGLDTRIVRLFNTYGPRLRSRGIYARAVSRFTVQALSGKDITVHGRGDQTRSFCYITDTAVAVLMATGASGMKGEVVNVGNPQEISILELAQRIKKITNSKSRISFHPRPKDDPERRCPDIRKAKRILGWYPVVILNEGLANTVEWFRNRI